MKIRKVSLILGFVLLGIGNIFSQGSNCNTATPFCSDASLSFPNNTNVSVQSGPNYGCLQDPNLLGMQNPSWHYLQINNGGSLEIEINQQSNGTGLDLDFAMWGPYTDVNAGCAAIMGGSVPPIQCSSDPDDTETIGIGTQGGGNYWSQQYSSSINGQSTPPAAQSGEYYIVIITNASNSNGTITFDQVGGTGDTNCDIVTNTDHCDISNLTATASCNGNNTTITGSFVMDANYTTGTVTVSSPCGGSQTFNPADWAGTSAVLNYSISGGVGTGNSCVVNVSFSGDPSCSATQTVTMPNCNPPCGVSLSTNNAALCVGENITLTATPSGGTWSSSDSTIATVVNGVVTAVGNGQAVITYDTGNCQANATISSSTVVTPSFANPGPICVGANLVLPTTSTNGVAGVWFPAANNTATTTYTFTSNGGQCVNDTTMTIEVLSDVIPLFSNPGSICEGDELKLPNVSNNGISGIWTPKVNNTQTTTYSFIVNDSNSCASNTTMTVVVHNIVFTPDVTVIDSVVKEGNSTQLNVTISPFSPTVTYSWNPSETLSCSNCPNPTANPTEPTWYYVTLTDSNGCKVKSSIFVDYRMNCGDIFIPNIFTPNDDGENDIFKPYGRCLGKGEIFIYNRWGEKIFYTDDVVKGWDGSQRGKLVNGGIYHYYMNLSTIYGDNYEFKGTITLVK